MPQSFKEWLEKNDISEEIDFSYEEIEEENLVISGNKFPKLKELTSLCGKNKFRKVTLRGLTKLEKLEMLSCQIQEIEISNCPKLSYIDIRNNLLIDLNFLDNLRERLIHLDISNNNLKGWLPFLGNFKNLETLYIGNRINSDIISFVLSDCFEGSLEKLRELSKLKKIDISNTNINSGLKCLPKSAEKIGCFCYYFWKRKCFVIKEELKDYPLENEREIGEWYSVSSWRKKQPNAELDKKDEEPIVTDLEEMQKIEVTRNRVFKEEPQLVENKLEKIIEEEKPSLMKKLKMDNENWEKEISESLSNLHLVPQLEKQARIIVNYNYSGTFNSNASMINAPTNMGNQPNFGINNQANQQALFNNSQENLIAYQTNQEQITNQQAQIQLPPKSNHN